MSIPFVNGQILTAADLNQLVPINPATGRVDTPAAMAALNGPVAMTSGVWTSVSSFCQVVLAGSGSYTYDTQDAAGVVTTRVGYGSAPDTVPIYMGGAVYLRFNFPNTATAKVN